MPDHPEEPMDRRHALHAIEDAQGPDANPPNEAAPGPGEPAPEANTEDEPGNIAGRPVEDRTFEAVETGASAAAGVGVGAVTGGPIGAAVGGVIGAAVGAAAGETVEKAAGPAAQTMDTGSLPEHDETQDEAADAEEHRRAEHGGEQVADADERTDETA